jgi:hypothetical protein
MSDPRPPQNPFDLSAFRKPQRGPTPEQLADALGPFSPPEEFQFESEFDPPVPRPIPKSAKRGSNASRRRATPLILVVLGIGFFVFRMLPSIENLGWYFLPLWYLDWVGLGLFVLGIGCMIRNAFALDDFRYIRDGIPVVGRVIHLNKADHTQFIDGVPTTEMSAYHAFVEYTNPQRDEREFVVFSTAAFPTKQSDRYDSGIETGDYVTLVSLPGDFATQVRLYAWSGLCPENDFPTCDGSPLKGVSPLKAILFAKSVFLGLWLFVGLLHVIQYFPEEDGNWGWVAFFAATGLILGAFGGVVAAGRGNRTLAAGAKPTHPWVAGPLGAFFGTLFGLFAFGLMNSLFDRGPASLRSVEVVQHWETTHSGIFRTYEVERRLLAGGRTEKKGISARDLVRLHQHRFAVEVHRPGLFGLSWVEGIRPVDWRPAHEPPTPEEVNRIVKFQGADAREPPWHMIPYVPLDKKQELPPPPDLLPLVSQEFAQQRQLQIIP